jgi:hypothetical protein
MDEAGGSCNETYVSHCKRFTARALFGSNGGRSFGPKLNEQSDGNKVEMLNTTDMGRCLFATEAIPKNKEVCEFLALHPNARNMKGFNDAKKFLPQDVVYPVTVTKSKVILMLQATNPIKQRGKVVVPAAFFGELAATGDKAQANAKYSLSSKRKLEDVYPEVVVSKAAKELGDLYIHKVRSTKEIGKEDEIVVHYGTSFVKKINAFSREVDEIDEVLASCSAGSGWYRCSFEGCRFSLKAARTKQFSEHILRNRSHLKACRSSKEAE